MAISNSSLLDIDIAGIELDGDGVNGSEMLTLALVFG